MSTTMTDVSVSAEFDVSSDRLWEVVADFGNVAWIPGMTGVRVDGEGPGMTRFLPTGDVEVHERLESVDPSAKTLVYSIPKNIPFAVTGYRATMRVEDAGGGCRLVWSCTCEPEGMSEDEARQTIQGLYEMMIGWLREYAKQS